MKITIVFMLLNSVCLTVHGASPLHDISETKVPFVGDRSVISTSNDSTMTVSITHENESTQIHLIKNNNVLSRVKIAKDISVYSIRWNGQSPWFVLRQKVNAGSLAVAIATFSDLKTEGKIEFYSPNVSSPSISGRVFDIKNVGDEDLVITFSSHNPTNDKISYYTGKLNILKMEKIEDDQWVIR